MENFEMELVEALYNLETRGDCGQRAIVTHNNDGVQVDFFDGLVLDFKPNGTWTWSKRKV